MYAAVTKSMHLLHSFLCGPTLRSHAIGSNHHSRAIFAETAVNEDFLSGILADDFYEALEHLVSGKRTIPGQRNVSHAQTFDQGFVASRSARINDDRDSHACEFFKAFFRRLTAAIQRRRDLPKVWYAFRLQVLPHQVVGRTRASIRSCAAGPSACSDRH